MKALQLPTNLQGNVWRSQLVAQDTELRCKNHLELELTGKQELEEAPHASALELQLKGPAAGPLALTGAPPPVLLSLEACEGLDLLVQHHDDAQDTGAEDLGKGAVQDVGADLLGNGPLVIGKGADPVSGVEGAREGGVALQALDKVLKGGGPAVRDEVGHGLAPEEAYERGLLLLCKRLHDVGHDKVHVSLENEALEVLPEVLQSLHGQSLVPGVVLVFGSRKKCWAEGAASSLRYSRRASCSGVCCLRRSQATTGCSKAAQTPSGRTK